ncbi:MAG: helix-turn-helix transcriptional regulator [Proteobacteria bacterium]|nr:helix-turn-helix transcriptional regulator [Pseudomonadota bacterium]
MDQPVGQDFVGTIDGQDLLKVHVQLSGHRYMTFEKRHEISLRGAATALLMHDDGVRKVERLPANQESKSLTISMRRSQLWDYLEDESTVVSPTLRAFICRKRSTPRLTVAPPTDGELSATAGVIDCALVPSIPLAHIENRIMVLFSHILDRFQADEGAQPRILRVTERDRRLLNDLRQFLETCFTEPPTLHQLARQFGINRNKLCTGFHLLYGTTVYDFCRALRLQKAQQLLADPQLSLTDIAFSAGFGSASAFSTAFARHFGAPPSQFRAS